VTDPVTTAAEVPIWRAEGPEDLMATLSGIVDAGCGAFRGNWNVLSVGVLWYFPSLISQVTPLLTPMPTRGSWRVVVVDHPDRAGRRGRCRRDRDGGACDRGDVVRGVGREPGTSLAPTVHEMT
jgi:hypothetical protein